MFKFIFKNRETGLRSWVYCQKRLRYFLGGERSALEPISSNFPFANTPRLDFPSSAPFCPVTILSDFIYSQSHQYLFTVPSTFIHSPINIYSQSHQHLFTVPSTFIHNPINIYSNVELQHAEIHTDSIVLLFRIRGGRSGVRIPAGGRTFLSPLTYPGRLWSPSSLPFNGYRDCFPGTTHR